MKSGEITAGGALSAMSLCPATIASAEDPAERGFGSKSISAGMIPARSIPRNSAALRLVRGITEALSLAESRYLAKGIVQEAMMDTGLGEAQLQPTVSVEIDLEAKRTPGGDTHIAKAKLLIDKIEVVVQALAVIRFEEGLVGLFVAPRLVGLTWLHGREDMNEPGVIASFLEDLLNACFFSEILLADEIDLETIFRGNPFGILPQFISKGFRKTRVVKDTDVLVAQVAGHPLSIAERGQSSLNHHTIKAGENSRDLVRVTFNVQ